MVVVVRPTSVLRGFLPLLFFFILGHLCATFKKVPTIPQCKRPLQFPTKPVGIEVAGTKIFLMSSAKAGAQLTWRLNIDHANKTAEALQLTNFPFEWMAKRYPIEFPGAQTNPSVEAIKMGVSRKGWQPVGFIRNPLDRAISAFMHVMGTRLVESWLKANNQLRATASCQNQKSPGCIQNITFVEFEDALTHYAFDGARQYPGDGHMTSQAQFFDLFPNGKGVTLIPVEMMVPEAAGDYCPPLHQFVKLIDPFRLTEREEAVNDMLHSGMHVKRQYNANLQDMDMNPDADSSHIPFTKLREAREAGHFPKYDSFFRDKELCRHVVGCLYARDLAQYLRVCRQPQFRECSFFQKTCREQIRRLRDVCGLEDLMEEYV